MRLNSPVWLVAAGFVLFSTGLVWALLPLVRPIDGNWSFYAPIAPLPERLMGLGLLFALLGLGILVKNRRKPKG